MELKTQTSSSRRKRSAAASSSSCDDPRTGRREKSDGATRGADQYGGEGRPPPSEAERRVRHALKAEGLAKAEAESVMRRNIGVAEATPSAREASRGGGAPPARRGVEALNEAGLSIEALKVLRRSRPRSRSRCRAREHHDHQPRGNGGGRAPRS